MSLYERIRKLRTDAGMSQEDLAHAMGYKDRSMITKIESGKVDISQKKIVKFAQVLNTSVEYLMGWDAEEDSQIHMDLQHFASDEKPKTEEARIISAGIDKMSPERREQALKVLQTIFSEYFDGGESNGT